MRECDAGVVKQKRGDRCGLLGFRLCLRGVLFFCLPMKVRSHRVSLILSLLDMIQLESKDITDRTVDVMLAHMRPKLGAWAAHIETARGIGYRLVP